MGSVVFVPNWRRCTLLDLYEQCSLHITEYMASSLDVGRRPRMCRIRAYSSSARPSSRYGWGTSGECMAALDGVELGLDAAWLPSAPVVMRRPRREHALEQRREEAQSVGAPEAPRVAVRAEARLDRVLRVRHQADDAAAGVRDARDVPVGAVRVAVEVAGDHVALLLEAVQRRVVRDVPALAVLERDHDLLTGGVAARPGGRGALDPQPLVLADELAVVVAYQRPGEQVRLAEHLEAVADPEDRATRLSASAAATTTSAMIGENRAIAPQRR